MLADSPAGVLRPIGPTRDTGPVQTTDIPPLVLADYLSDSGNDYIKTDCSYSFAADGTVSQACP